MRWWRRGTAAWSCATSRTTTTSHTPLPADCTPLPADSLAFTFCQIPVVYHRGRDAEPMALTVQLADGTTKNCADGELDADLSASVFNRDGRVQALSVRGVRSAGD